MAEVRSSILNWFYVSSLCVSANRYGQKQWTAAMKLHQCYTVHLCRKNHTRKHCLINPKDLYYLSVSYSPYLLLFICLSLSLFEAGFSTARTTQHWMGVYFAESWARKVGKIKDVVCFKVLLSQWALTRIERASVSGQRDLTKRTQFDTLSPHQQPLQHTRACKTRKKI
jgi:hypothetical protein